ncbi:MAG: DUF2336 domain-containing protein [Roseitalea sp.]|nr:DUF2336 domain-containing protein [Roseitalea sp.]MBO6722218.1 DUF2336 domain-containing protein [Roseitalea sp.]MBO6744991.1 DUF2336 domain-containing protein [Roseitalea sp.]
MIVQHFLKWKDSANVARRTAAASALARAYLTSDLDLDDRVAAEAALTLLLDDPSPKVRFALAEALASSVHAPAQIVTALVHDQIDIASIVIARSPVVRDGDLIERARSSPEALQCVIAGRAEVSQPLALALTRHGSAASAIVLIANANARLCRQCRMFIVERHGSDASVRGALLDCPDLEADLRYRLMKAAGRALADSPFLRGLAGSETADHLISESEQKAVCALLATVDASASDALVDTMRDHGDLTTVLLVRAACRGQIDFLASVLSDLAEVPLQRVTSILVNERSNQLRALLTNAGLADSIQPVLVHAVGLWRDVAVGRTVAGVQEVTRRIIERIETEGEARRSAANDDIVGVLRSIHLDAMRDNARAHARDLAAA